MLQLSHFSFDFATDIGGEETIIPCCRYRDIMTGPESNDWQTSMQTEQLIASPWLYHHGRGNAAKTLGFTVLRAFPTRAQAEQYAADREALLNLHPNGSGLYCGGWHGGMPMLTERWRATVQRCRAVPPSEETIAPAVIDSGLACAAFCAVEYSFLLTHREIV